MDYLKTLPAPHQWSEWLAAEAPISAEYRESTQPLYAEPFGDLTRDNPAPVEPGMVSASLDGAGRLLNFDAIPYPEASGLSQPVAPESVFRAAGLDIASFTETAPSVIPRGPTDRLRAWKGPHPVLPHTALTVEIGWWKDRVTSVKVIAPWRKQDVGSNAPPDLAGRAALYGIFLWLLFARFALAGVAWIGAVHAVPDIRTLYLLFQATGE